MVNSRLTHTNPPTESRFGINTGATLHQIDLHPGNHSCVHRGFGCFCVLCTYRYKVGLEKFERVVFHGKLLSHRGKALLACVFPSACLPGQIPKHTGLLMSHQHESTKCREKYCETFFESAPRTFRMSQNHATLVAAATTANGMYLSSLCSA